MYLYLSYIYRRNNCSYQNDLTFWIRVWHNINCSKCPLLLPLTIDWTSQTRQPGLGNPTMRLIRYDLISQINLIRNISGVWFELACPNGIISPSRLRLNWSGNSLYTFYLPGFELKRGRPINESIIYRFQSYHVQEHWTPHSVHYKPSMCLLIENFKFLPRRNFLSVPSQKQKYEKNMTEVWMEELYDGYRIKRSHTLI